MKLYITDGSPYARIVRVVVFEKKLQSRVEICAAQTRVADSPYYQINPSGRVPYLVRDDGVGLEESALICDYLDHIDGRPTFHLPDREQGWEGRRLEALARSMTDGLADGCAGSVLSMQVFEHVEDPVRAARETFRVLRQGGVAVIAVPFMTSYHGKRPPPKNPLYERGAARASLSGAHGEYGDFWRYTHEGLMRLLADAGFARVEVWPIDGPMTCRLELMNWYRHIIRIAPLRRLLARMDPPRLGSATSGHVALAHKL